MLPQANCTPRGYRATPVTGQLTRTRALPPGSYEIHMMKIGIIGAGALGSLIAFYLSAHADIWLLSRRREQIDTINRNGLRRELDGIEDTRYPHAAADPATIGPCDIVLVLTKSYATIWAAEQAQQLIKTEGQGLRTASATSALSPQPSVLSPLVVTLQNGLGNRELLARSLGEAHVGQG